MCQKKHKTRFFTNCLPVHHQILIIYIYHLRSIFNQRSQPSKTSPASAGSCWLRGAQLQVVRREIVAKERQLAMLPGGRQEAWLGFWEVFGDGFLMFFELLSPPK